MSEIATDRGKQPPPSGKNYAQRQRDADQAFLKMLVEQFPACFSPHGHRGRRPLKVGIGDDVAAKFPEVPRGRVSRVLFHYTGAPDYLAALVEGVERRDLDGNFVGVVTAEQAREATRRELGLRAALEMSATCKRLQRAVDAVAKCLGDRLANGEKLDDKPDGHEVVARLDRGRDPRRDGVGNEEGRDRWLTSCSVLGRATRSPW